MRPARVPALAGIAALALTATGCALPGGGAPTVTVTETVDSDAAEAPQGSTTDTSEDLGTLTGAGRKLDRAELEAALPTPEEVQPGWEEDPVETVGEIGRADVSPTECAALIQKGPGWDETKASQRARAQVNHADPDNPPPPGTVRHHIGIWAYSFDDPYPVGLFDQAGARVAECAEFDVHQSDTGNTSEYTATSLAFPNLGDRTLALRFEVQQTMETITMDFVVVKVGHNTFSIANTTYNGQPSTERTERAARAVLAGLAEGQ